MTFERAIYVRRDSNVKFAPLEQIQQKWVPVLRPGLREDKEQMIETIFRGRVSNEIVELMKLMIEKGRYSKIDSVFEYFIGLVKEEKKIGIAYIATAVELSEAQKEAVMQRLLQTTKYESFEMNYQVDASLIGGMVIRIGDRVVDTSIKTKLYELSKRLKKIQV